MRLSGLLALPTMYRLFVRLIGSGYRAVYATEHIRAQAGDRVLDLGCGTGETLGYLPNVDYLGVDVSEEYIRAAQARFGERGRFICRSIHETRVEELGDPASFDLVLANGVLHHLDDRDALHLFALAGEALKPSGRLVTFDGCFVPGQSRIARYLLRRDRGKHVRSEEGYAALARQAFHSVRATIRHDLLRIPYSHIILECGEPRVLARRQAVA